VCSFLKRKIFAAMRTNVFSHNTQQQQQQDSVVVVVVEETQKSFGRELGHGVTNG
jgi:hypothetical protein